MRMAQQSESHKWAFIKSISVAKISYNCDKIKHNKQCIALFIINL